MFYLTVRELTSEFDIDTEDNMLESDGDLEKQIISNIIDELGATEEQIEEMECDPEDAMIKALEKKGMSNEDASDLVLISYGSTKDDREHAIKKWGWSRVHGAHIEVNKLTGDQLRTVAKGIWNALGEEGNVNSDEEYADAGKTIYGISTYTGKSYNITLDDMDSGNVEGLEQAIEFDENNEISRLMFTEKGDNRANLYIKRLVPRIDNFKIENVSNLHGETEVTLIRTN